MTASILTIFRHCLIRRHLQHGQHTRLVSIHADGVVLVKGHPEPPPAGTIVPQRWVPVGAVEGLMGEIEASLTATEFRSLKIRSLNHQAILFRTLTIVTIPVLFPQQQREQER